MGNGNRPTPEFRREAVRLALTSCRVAINDETRTFSWPFYPQNLAHNYETTELTE